jgi:ATP-dependent DNA helicase RecQ
VQVLGDGMNQEHLKILKESWGFDNFRGIQAEVIDSISAGRDTLALMPTGGGKSVCFQVPALATRGLCLVISPLIALMNDQVANLKSKGIRAELITSELHRKDIEIILGNCLHDARIKFLYVSPERLKTDVFVEAFKQMNICLIAVDEAHCISQWGYDFRPAYLEISEIRKWHPNVPVLALTATATTGITKDICRHLGFPEEQVIRMSFGRKNLSYVTIHTEEKFRKIQLLLDKIPGSAIIYAGTRRRVKEIADTLRKFGYTACFYHAGLSSTEKKTAEIYWKSGEKRVIVATNAFGMGIDKPDVRLVIHADMPSEPEAYFQEAGRAGRDGLDAYAVLLWNRKDIEDLDLKIKIKYPIPELIKMIYSRLANHCQVSFGAGAGMSGPLKLGELCEQTGRSATEVYAALKLLEIGGYIRVPEPGETRSRVRIVCDNRSLYEFRLRHPNMEPLINFMLRMLEGVFEQFCNLDEDFLKLKLKLSDTEFARQMNFLVQNRIIEYHPIAREPIVVFEQARPVADGIILGPEIYRDRKKIDMLRANAMRSYVMGMRCRSLALVEYFGEKNSTDCGRCDQCRRAKKWNLTVKELEDLTSEIERSIRENAMTSEELLLKFPLKVKEAVSGILRWKMDIGLWALSPEGHIRMVHI